MMLCLGTAGAVTALAVSSFTLGWTHSVEKTRWQEHWVVAGDRLELVEASVQGSGAGIAVPDDAVWADGRWTYKPAVPPLPELVLAASGATPGAWQLCLPDGACRDLGGEAGEPVRIWVAPTCPAK